MSVPSWICVSVLFTLLTVFLWLGCSGRQHGVVQRNAAESTSTDRSENSNSPRTVPSKAVPISPYDIQKSINQHNDDETELVDFRPIWKMMQVKPDEEGIFDGFVPSSSRWHAELFSAGTQVKKARPLVLKISANGGADRRYLIFSLNRSYRSTNVRWQFSGCIDVLDNKYEGSPHQAYHRIVSSEKHTWLVLRALANSGTGVYQINEVWHEIDSNDPPKKVLEYPIKGHFAQGDVCDRAFGSRIVSQQRVNGVYVIEIQLSVTYGLERPVFSKTQTASYVWARDLAEFVFDQSNSKISKQEMELVYNTGFLKDEMFLSYNYSDLKRIASHGNKVQKNWLEWVLSKTDDVPEKRPLLNRLRR